MSTSTVEAKTTETAATGSPLVVYFSSISENTHKFIQKLGIRNVRLPLKTAEEPPTITEPYVLCIPSYGRPGGAGSIPPQAVKFLNNPTNREHLKGVIGAGNTNFGELYCVAADKVAAKCQVPVLYKFELMGTAEDVTTVQKGLEEFWIQNSLR